ncbi:MBL fold metallo-hydrolase [Rhodohalobacter sp. SW132]|uniref:MBL fold metallo-hydrolase n=1 Tax=Rhodohalobacter sp. SW132 TaxID=2293433 RepID=UPI000E24434A|nr:MBL fold metallo-hydrolase [Rhodohalobacter sp. SW132]REL33285.1 MBL fold metallo-hydrolase [Rhodohalobacter sp. SW132]
MATVTPLYEGTFSVGLDKEFNRIDRNDPPKKGALKLSINPFLIQDNDRNILFDAGIGDLLGNDTTIDTILENLDNHSVQDYEITDIFLSHLHFDHIAGIANQKNGYWELTFPDAAIWVSKAEWEKLRSIIDEQDDSKRDFFYFVDSHADLHFFESDVEEPIPNVRVERIGGHTEYHNALFYENGDSKFVMAGDVIGTRGAVNRTYAAKYDFDPKQSMEQRKRIQELAYKKNHAILAYHETDHPVFKLTDYSENKGYNIENQTE